MAQATLGPFIYDDAGFQVQVTVGRGTQCHSRMDCEELYALITSSKSHAVPYGTSSGFYAAQLQHYGLPVPTSTWPNNVAQALETFKAVFKLKDGKHKLSVPASITSIKKKLKDEYEETSLKTKEARVAIIEAELEKARKAEESLAKELKSLQADLKGKKRKAMEPTAQCVEMACRSGNTQATLSADVANVKSSQSPNKKRRVEQPHQEQSAASKVPDPRGETLGNRREEAENGGTSGDTSDDSSAEPEPSSTGCTGVNQRKRLAKRLRQELTGVWKFSTRSQPSGTAGWIAIAKMVKEMSQQQAQDSDVSPRNYVGRFCLDGVKGDFYCRSTETRLVGASLKIFGRWELCGRKADTTFAYPNHHPSKKQLKSMGKIELFFDGTRIDAYLSDKKPLEEVVTFESCGVGDDFIGHPLARGWTTSAWSRLKPSRSDTKAKNGMTSVESPNNLLNSSVQL